MIVTKPNKEDEQQIYESILDQTVQKLREETTKDQAYFRSRTGVKLEKDIFEILKDKSIGTIIEGKNELVSGQSFPDIVSYINEQKAYGLEVKTTKENKWKSTGSSIFEGTRVKEVERIYLLFGKMTETVEYKCKPYEECLYNVAITHSPRYLIDMEIEKEETIFSKANIPYDELRKMENPFAPIKNHLRKQLKNKSEGFWWIDTPKTPIIKNYSNIPKKDQQRMNYEGYALFPELLSNRNDRFSKLSTYQVSKYLIVNHALRDTYTSGGQFTYKNVKLPKIYKKFIQGYNEIKSEINELDKEDIEHYWGFDPEDRVKYWESEIKRYMKKHLNKEQYDIITNNLKLEF